VRGSPLETRRGSGCREGWPGRQPESRPGVVGGGRQVVAVMMHGTLRGVHDLAADSLRWRWRDAPAAGAAPLETRMGSGWA
jgi:hypothetical protein